MQLPYYCDWVNCLWMGLWTGILYTSALLVASSGSDDAGFITSTTWVSAATALTPAMAKPALDNVFVMCNACQYICQQCKHHFIVAVHNLHSARYVQHDKCCVPLINYQRATQCDVRTRMHACAGCVVWHLSRCTCWRSHFTRPPAAGQAAPQGMHGPKLLFMTCMQGHANHGTR